ncbi:Fic/DOC family protein [Lihuaxuella thermophila]|uniref:protein adenylyltransferase n=1 Tax=Lihuaxuella thermophila TaxID=1173111 RepID=A0A1H8F3Y0_9BACL|nr:Fic family protein [Lihuaxuella thermophila]SEN26591.1 cell filamentation protein [Lihuaxuella thermophila]
MVNHSRYGSDQSRYCYPGTGVLVNHANIRDQEKLLQYEIKVTGIRIAELIERPIEGAFDLPHLQKIHYYIFQDVYPFAGKIREENIAKGTFTFAQAKYIVPSAEALFRQLHEERCLSGLNGAEFADRAAFYMGELNVLHPFREGNGRALREFIRTLGLNAGYHLDWSRLDHGMILQALIRSTFDCRELADVIRACMMNPTQE